jgi:hypothetical protein
VPYSGIFCTPMRRFEGIMRVPSKPQLSFLGRYPQPPLELGLFGSSHLLVAESLSGTTTRLS